MWGSKGQGRSSTETRKGHTPTLPQLMQTPQVQMSTGDQPATVFSQLGAYAPV